MNTKAFFPCVGGSNLILGIGRENQIFLLRTPAAVKLPGSCLNTGHFEKTLNRGGILLNFYEGGWGSKIFLGPTHLH